MAIVFTKVAVTKIFLPCTNPEGCDNKITFSIMLYYLFYIIKKCVISMLFGFFMGLFTSLITRFNRALGKEPITETMIVVLMGYSSHMIVEAYGYSGIISVFVCG